MDRLAKSACFLPIKISYLAEEYARLYIREILGFHGAPSWIISDRGAQFTSHFWRSFYSRLGTQVKLSIAFHPNIDGQAKRTIQTLEYMLRVCVIDFKGNKYVHLPLIEFSYKNIYHSSILCHHLKHSMVGGVSLRLDGLKWVSFIFLVLRYSISPQRKFDS